MTDSIEGLVASVWSRPEYAAADLARQNALADDPNDQMSALAAAVDAALSSAQAEIERLRDERDDLFEWLGLVLGADPGPKLTSAFQGAREVWNRIDARFATSGDRPHG